MESMFDASESWSSLWTQTRVVPDKIQQVKICLKFQLAFKVETIGNMVSRFLRASCLWITPKGYTWDQNMYQEKKNPLW